jgi:hypothetical protein
MHPVVMLEPWNPWPLVFPAVVFMLGAVLAIAGRGRQWLRAAAAMLGFLSGTWDQGQRLDALVELGYETPTFSGGEGIVGGTPGAIDFTATRGGERVQGQLVPLGDAQWQVVEAR